MSNSSSQTTIPCSVSKALEFLEQVALDLEGVANHVTSVLTQREFGVIVGVSPAFPDDDESLVAMIQRVRWTEARQRAALLAGLPVEAVREVTSVLDHELTVDSIGDVRRRFRPALQKLRHESGCDYATPLPELIERLLAGPDDAEISPHELAFLEAQLEQGISFSPLLCHACGEPLSQKDRAAGRYTCYSHSPGNPGLEAKTQARIEAKQAKLKVICSSNRNLREWQLRIGVLPTKEADTEMLRRESSQAMKYPGAIAGAPRPANVNDDKGDHPGDVKTTMDGLSGRSLRLFQWLAERLNRRVYFDELRDESTVFTKSGISDQGIKSGIKCLIGGLDELVAPFIVEWSMADKWVKLVNKPGPQHDVD